jgi:Flp pilus assembly protein TadB
MSNGATRGLSSAYWLSGAAVLLIAGVFFLVVINIGGGLFFLAVGALALLMALRRR